MPNPLNEGIKLGIPDLDDVIISQILVGSSSLRLADLACDSGDGSLYSIDCDNVNTQDQDDQALRGWKLTE